MQGLDHQLMVEAGDWMNDAVGLEAKIWLMMHYGVRADISPG